MRGPRTFAGSLYRFLWIISKVKRNGRKPHQRPIPCCRGIGRAAVRFASLRKTCQRGSHRHPYVKHFAVAAQMRFSKPASIAFQLIDRIKRALFNQALRQAQRHRSVVSPLAWSETERAAANDSL